MHAYAIAWFNALHDIIKTRYGLPLRPDLEIHQSEDTVKLGVASGTSWRDQSDDQMEMSMCTVPFPWPALRSLDGPGQGIYTCLISFASRSSVRNGSARTLKERPHRLLVCHIVHHCLCGTLLLGEPYS
jgi:hypothetical protein